MVHSPPALLWGLQCGVPTHPEKQTRPHSHILLIWFSRTGFKWLPSVLLLIIFPNSIKRRRKDIFPEVQISPRKRGTAAHQGGGTQLPSLRVRRQRVMLAPFNRAMPLPDVHSVVQWQEPLDLSLTLLIDPCTLLCGGRDWTELLWLTRASQSL